MLRYFFIPILMVTSLVSFAQQQAMYVGTYTGNGSKGVYIYDFDEKTGDAKFEKSIAMSNPSFLVRKGHSLYAVNEDSQGKVTAVDLNTTSIMNSLSTDGAHPCHVSVSPKYPVLAVSNYSGGSLVLYSLNADGSLNKQEDFMQFSGSSVNKERQQKSHVHSAFFSPDGERLFVSDLGRDLIYQFEIIKGTHGDFKLHKVGEIKVKAGGGPRHVVIANDVKRVYVVLELTGEIEVLESVNNVWTSKQIVPIYKEGFVGGHGAADIKMSSDGKFVYATNRGDSNEIVVYSVAKNGMLTLQQVQSVEGISPRNVQISPKGNWIIIGNQVSGNLTFFKRDKKNGRLIGQAKTIDIPSAVCTIF